MPTYCFSCESPAHSEPVSREVFEWIAKSPEAPICECGQTMDRDWGMEHRGFSHKTVFPYVTKNLTGDGKPIEVRDAGHQRELMKRYGKTQRDDASFEHEESYVDRRGRWQLRDTGNGLPGRWR